MYYFQVANDYMAVKKEMALMGGVAVILSLLMVVLIRYFACVLIWTMYVLSGVLSLAAMGYCWWKYVQYKSMLDAVPEDEQLVEDQELVKDWMIYSIIGTVITVILLLVLLVLRSRLALVVQLFKEAGDAVGKMPLILLQPLWTLIVVLGLIILLAFGAVYVFTAAYPEVDPETGFVSYEINDHIFVSIITLYFIFSSYVTHFVLMSE